MKDKKETHDWMQVEHYFGTELGGIMLTCLHVSASEPLLTIPIPLLLQKPASIMLGCTQHAAPLIIEEYQNEQDASISIGNVYPCIYT